MPCSWVSGQDLVPLMVPGAEMRVRLRGCILAFRAGQGCHPGLRAGVLFLQG